MSITLSYATPTTCAIGDAVYATAWAPDLGSITGALVDVTVTLVASAVVTSPPLSDNRIEIYAAPSTDTGGHLDPVLETGVLIASLYIDPITGETPTDHSTTVRVQRPPDFDGPDPALIRVAVYCGTTETGEEIPPNSLTLHSISLLIEDVVPVPCEPFVLAADWETIATDIVDE
jgi:hypothetical protein